MDTRLTARHVHLESFNAIPPYAVCPHYSTFYKLLNYVDKHNSSLLNLQISGWHVMLLIRNGSAEHKKHPPA